MGIPPPHVWVRMRVACGIFNVVLGVLLLASFRWLGPLTWLAALPLAGAALIFWTVYPLQASTASRLGELAPSRGHFRPGPAAALRPMVLCLPDTGPPTPP